MVLHFSSISFIYVPFSFCLVFSAEHFEYEIVVVVDNEAEINTARELRGSKFCHPGHGLKNHWTAVLADVSMALKLLECLVIHSMLQVFFCG